MDRRRFLGQNAIWAALGALTSKPHPRTSAEGQVMTVSGPIASEMMGTTLPHEHLMSTFGAAPSPRPGYDEAALLQAVLPRLHELKRLGCQTIIDCTAAYFGRDPALLRRLSETSGLHILTNTGYYGAADDRYVPAHAYKASADDLAAQWLDEWENGIDGTSVRPGFIKIGVDAGPLSDVDRKLVRAAARLHRASGLTIAVHTGNNEIAAREQLAVLREEGVAPAAWIWVHAHQAERTENLIAAAQAGAWVSLDGLGEDTLESHLALLQALKNEGVLGQVLLSHDGNSYRAGGRPPRPYKALFTRFLSMLREAGCSDEEIKALIATNPQRAFTVGKRLSR
ncbi:MAG: phosphotriesterase family protein [Rhodothermales bacterium]